MELQAAVAFVLAYLLGSVDFGVIVPRLMGVDIRQHGSGNPGASNVLRTLGKGAFAATLAGDFAKGAVAAAIGDLWVSEAAGFACGFAAAIGHCYPLWHGFRGGKGVAAVIGALLWLEPVVGVASVLVWGGIAFGLKLASVASLVLAGAWLPVLAAFGHRGWSLGWTGAAIGLIVIRHRGNIRRLLAGEERRIGAR